MLAVFSITELCSEMFRVNSSFVLGQMKLVSLNHQTTQTWQSSSVKLTIANQPQIGFLERFPQISHNVGPSPGMPDGPLHIPDSRLTSRRKRSIIELQVLLEMFWSSFEVQHFSQSDENLEFVPLPIVQIRNSNYNKISGCTHCYELVARTSA